MVNVNPFVGLRPFEEDEDWRFFGRDREAKILHNLIYSIPILVVFAPSGVGKSSLIRAGVVPLLREDESITLIAGWEWGSGPRQMLRELINDALGRDGSSSDPIVTELEGYWEETKRRPMLILDQFEEILRDQDERDEVLREIALIANRPNGHSRIVISIREDYLGNLNELMVRVPNLMDNHLRLSPLSSKALTEAFRRPLSAMIPPFDAEDLLVDEMIRDLQGAGPESISDGSAEPGYFQLVASYLWEEDHDHPDRRLTLRTYRESGRASGIVNRFIQKTLEELLSEEERQVLYALVRYMVLPSGAKVPVSVSDLEGLVRAEDFTEYARSTLDLTSASDSSGVFSLASEEMSRTVQAVLDKVTRGPALMFRRLARGNRIEYQLAHDLLGPILNRWREAFARDSAVRLRDVYQVQLREAYSSVTAAESWPPPRTSRSKVPWRPWDPQHPLEPELVADHKVLLYIVVDDLVEGYWVGLSVALWGRAKAGDVRVDDLRTLLERPVDLTDHGRLLAKLAYYGAILPTVPEPLEQRWNLVEE